MKVKRLYISEVIHSRFALPILDENEEVMRYNVFHAELVIRHSFEGKLYLYDVINKKRNGYPAWE